MVLERHAGCRLHKHRPEHPGDSARPLTTPRRKPEGDGDRYFADWVGRSGRRASSARNMTTWLSTRPWTAGCKRRRSGVCRQCSTGAGTAAAVPIRARWWRLGPDGSVRALIGGTRLWGEPVNRATQCVAPARFRLQADGLPGSAGSRHDGRIRWWTTHRADQGLAAGQLRERASVRGRCRYADALAHSVNTSSNSSAGSVRGSNPSVPSPGGSALPPL